MNGQQGVDIVALSWCIPEIRESLARAATELDQHLGAEAGSTGHLKNARIHLHQAHGALQVADVAGRRQDLDVRAAVLVDGLGLGRALDAAVHADFRRGGAAARKGRESGGEGAGLSTRAVYNRQ